MSATRSALVVPEGVEVDRVAILERIPSVTRAEQVMGHHEYVMAHKSLCSCGSHRVHGKGDVDELFDCLFVSRAFCFDCGAKVGKLVVETNTIFGIREDRAVLGGPWKVY